MSNNNTQEQDNQTIPEKDIPWTEEHEIILVEWADKAMCYKWLHNKSNLKYSKLNLLFTIPVIIMSTLTGTANFAFQKYSTDVQSIASNITGGVNIFAAILTTIAQFLKIAELKESHRVSTIAWDKYYRNIKVEIARHPDERMNPTHMIKISKEEFDRLIDTNPIIDENILLEFQKTFAYKNDLIKKEQFNKIKKPEICDDLISTDNDRHHWFQMDKIDLKELEKIEEENLKKIEQDNINLINEFKKQFFELHNRDPLEDEIIDNLKEKINESVLILLIDKLNSFV